MCRFDGNHDLPSINPSPYQFERRSPRPSWPIHANHLDTVKIPSSRTDAFRLDQTRIAEVFRRKGEPVSSANHDDRIQLVIGDITTQHVDAIVNAANESLLGGGGVDGAIHRAAGPKLLQACRPLEGCPTGSARITPAFDLPARFVIHAVGPVYRDGTRGEPEQLAGCYRTAIRLASQNDCKTIALPAISCGVYHYPIPQAAHIALTICIEQFANHPNIEQVRFVLFSQPVFEQFQKVWDAVKT
jgi:O-acetyl-ADP-ribose deacetylase (regulator of RNase III)